MKTEENLVVECGAVWGCGRGRVERVGEDSQGVVAAVPVTGDGVKIPWVYP